MSYFDPNAPNSLDSSSSLRPVFNLIDSLLGKYIPVVENVLKGLRGKPIDTRRKLEEDLLVVLTAAVVQKGTNVHQDLQIIHGYALDIVERLEAEREYRAEQKAQKLQEEKQTREGVKKAAQVTLQTALSTAQGIRSALGVECRGELPAAKRDAVRKHSLWPDLQTYLRIFSNQGILGHESWVTSAQGGPGVAHRWNFSAEGIDGFADWSHQKKMEFYADQRARLDADVANLRRIWEQINGET